MSHRPDSRCGVRDGAGVRGPASDVCALPGADRRPAGAPARRPRGRFWTSRWSAGGTFSRWACRPHAPFPGGDERPLVCIVDDAQWLDDASAPVLAFLARRLTAQSIAIVFASRESSGGQFLAGLPQLPVAGLGEDDARELLESVLRGPIDVRIRDRIVAETRGNPLALLELARGQTATQFAGGFGLVGFQALRGRLSESCRRRLAEISKEASQLLLVAAAEPVGDPLLVWRALSVWASRRRLPTRRRDC